jgi:hypothetical protein
MLELRRANLLLLETVKEGSAITTGLSEDLRGVRGEKEEVKERTEMLSQENVDLRHTALDHKRVRREVKNLEAANNESKAVWTRWRGIPRSTKVLGGSFSGPYWRRALVRSCEE